VRRGRNGGRALRGRTLSSGGRGQSQPQPQRWLRLNESGVDAVWCRPGVGLDNGEAVRSHRCGGLRDCVQAVWLTAVGRIDERSRTIANREAGDGL